MGALADYTGLLDILLGTPCNTKSPTMPPSASGGRGSGGEEDDDDFVTPPTTGSASGKTLGIGLGAAVAVACSVGAVMYLKRRRSQLNSGGASAYSGVPKRRDSTSRGAYMTSKELGGSLNYDKAVAPSKPPKPEMYQNPMRDTDDLKV